MSAPSGSATTTTTTITISNLEENMQYEFILTATNTAGTSSAALRTITTLPASKCTSADVVVIIVSAILCPVPSESPQIILQSLNATSITISWSRESCLSRNGPDRFYTVRYFLTGTTQILATRNVAVDSRIFTVSSLVPNTSYSVQVAYSNTVGSGPFAAVAIATLRYDRKSLLICSSCLL